VSVVENISVWNANEAVFAAVASCRSAQVGPAVAPVPVEWGTGAPAIGSFTEGVSRITAPTMAAFQGTSVSTGGHGSGERQRYLQQETTFISTNPTKPTDSNADKNDVVVDDIPGARSWSPPV
jgi:hypothetical protein